MDAPNLVVLGGPNGSGKSTVAKLALNAAMGVEEFVNANLIASGLSGFQPETVAIEAGRIMVERLAELATKRRSFALETTLASRSLATWIRRLQLDSGYRFHLVYVWLTSPELNVTRVRSRVLQGGHDIPVETIRRRYFRSIRNLFDLYLPLADTWRVFDNSASGGPEQVAYGVRGCETQVFDKPTWDRLREMCDVRDCE